MQKLSLSPLHLQRLRILRVALQDALHVGQGGVAGQGDGGGVVAAAVAVAGRAGAVHSSLSWLAKRNDLSLLTDDWTSS